MSFKLSYIAPLICTYLLVIINDRNLWIWEDLGPELKKITASNFPESQSKKSLLLDTNSSPKSSGTGLKSGSAYDLVDLVTLAPLQIIFPYTQWTCTSDVGLSENFTISCTFESWKFFFNFWHFLMIFGLNHQEMKKNCEKISHTFKSVTNSQTFRY